MGTLYLDTSDASVPNARTSTASIPGSISSSATSVFSRGHVSRGSGSSVASSPVPRDSFDMYGCKRLEDVTEEPQEKDEFEGYTLVDTQPLDLLERKRLSFDRHRPSPPISPVQPELSVDDWRTSGPAYLQNKRRRSFDHPSTNNQRFHSRFGSISRRWKNRSAAAAPQLSIVTHVNSPASRSAPFINPHTFSPALSAISKHESIISASPTIPRAPSDTSLILNSDPIPIDVYPSEDDTELGQPATPLLPPMLSELCKKDTPVQSPLQSPSIAPVAAVMSSRNSFESPVFGLPSPPLSTRPSMVSMHNRSRTSTVTSPYGEIPPMYLVDDSSDPWAVKLGHANYTIHPEPYAPEMTDLDSYIEFRTNWDHARTNYAKHIARTAEHYGTTSKVYKLTEEKWSSVDAIWKKQHTLMQATLSPLLARLSDSGSDTQDSNSSSAILEKPVSKIVVPAIDDKSGKFPELGDGEIVGPMSVAPPKIQYPRSPPVSPHKRNLSKIIAAIFKT